MVFRFKENSKSIERSRPVSIKRFIHALICIEFFLILLHLFLFLRTNNHYLLKKIIIDGSYYTIPETIIDSLNFSQDANIFNTNLELIRKTLEKNIWIESSSVKIKYPGVLDISINEREPIALIKGKIEKAIDSKGMVLGNLPLSKKSCLPRVDGFSVKEIGAYFENEDMKKILVILQVLQKLSWFDNKCFSIKRTEDGFYLLRFMKKSFDIKISPEKIISQIARLISVFELFPDRIRVSGNRLFFDLTFPSRVIMRPTLEYGG